jgi:hypothetical protein
MFDVKVKLAVKGGSPTTRHITSGAIVAFGTDWEVDPSEKLLGRHGLRVVW